MATTCRAPRLPQHPMRGHGTNLASGPRGKTTLSTLQSFLGDYFPPQNPSTSLGMRHSLIGHQPPLGVPANPFLFLGLWSQAPGLSPVSPSKSEQVALGSSRAACSAFTEMGSSRGSEIISHPLWPQALSLLFPLKPLHASSFPAYCAPSPKKKC